MWWLVVFITLIFLLTPIIVNKSNAKHLLSGYNTMPDEDQKLFDIEGYITYFRKFFWFLGSAMLLGFIIIKLVFSEEFALIYFILIPVASLPFLIIKGKNFYDPSIRKRYSQLNNWAAGAMVLVLIGLIALFYYGLAPNELNIKEQSIEISGMYGEQIVFGNIKNIEVEESLPEIKIRTNGFAVGNHLKGNFRTTEGRNVKLLVEADYSPFLKIETTGKTIYWNTKDANIREVYSGITNQMN